MAKVVYKETTRTYEFSKEDLAQVLHMDGRIDHIHINGAFVNITTIEVE